MAGIKIFLNQNKYLVILTVLTVLFTLLPVFDIAIKVWNHWQGVPQTEMYTDSVHYYARMREIKDGHPFIGNPFYIEHRNDLTPLWFFSDWLYAAPFLLGLSLNGTLIFNFTFWSLLFVFLGYYFFGALGLSKKASALGSFFAFFTVYMMLLRPISFQVVYPVFLFFLLTFIFWLKNPENKKLIFTLAIFLAICLYAYPYLEQLALVFSFLWLAFFLFFKEFGKFKKLFCVLLLALVFSAPLIFFTLKQISNPYYWETMARIGLLSSHLPTAIVFYNGAWIFATLLLFALAQLFFKKTQAFKENSLIFRFLTVLGIAILAVSLSNVISGKELEIGMHMEFFTMFWLVISFVFALNFLVKNRREVFLKKGQQALLCFLLIVCFLGVVRYINRYSPLLFIRENHQAFKKYTIEIQDFAGPLNWLEKNEPEPSVIWSSYDSPLNLFIPVFTKHYVLFIDQGKMYLLPTKEQEERYLISAFSKNLSLSDLKNEFVIYAGRGPAIYQPNTLNRPVKICKLLRLDFFGADCGKMTDGISLRGEGYFNDLYREYQEEIKPNINLKLAHYGVAYIIKDKKVDKDFFPEKLNGTKLVYSDQRFLIYKITPIKI